MLFSSFSSALSTAGALLQLSGFVLIVLGIRRVARRFGEPRLHQRAWSWIRDFKEVWKPSPVTIRPEPISSEGTVFSPKVKPGHPDAETLEERVSVLESKVENLKEGHDALRKTTEKRINSLDSRIDEQEKKHSSGREEILDKVEEVAAGGLDWEFVAVVWLALGVSLRLLASWV